MQSSRCLSCVREGRVCKDPKPENKGRQRACGTCSTRKVKCLRNPPADKTLHQDIGNRLKADLNRRQEIESPKVPDQSVNPETRSDDVFSLDGAESIDGSATDCSSEGGQLATRQDARESLQQAMFQTDASSGHAYGQTNAASMLGYPAGVQTEPSELNALIESLPGNQGFSDGTEHNPQWNEWMMQNPILGQQEMAAHNLDNSLNSLNGYNDDLNQFDFSTGSGGLSQEDLKLIDEVSSKINFSQWSLGNVPSPEVPGLSGVPTLGSEAGREAVCNNLLDPFGNTLGIEGLSDHTGYQKSDALPLDFFGTDGTLLNLTDFSLPLELQDVTNSRYPDCNFPFVPEASFDGHSQRGSVPSSRMVDAATQTKNINFSIAPLPSWGRSSILSSAQFPPQPTHPQQEVSLLLFEHQQNLIAMGNQQNPGEWNASIKSEDSPGTDYQNLSDFQSPYDQDQFAGFPTATQSVEEIQESVGFYKLDEQGTGPLGQAPASVTDWTEIYEKDSAALRRDANRIDSMGGPHVAKLTDEGLPGLEAEYSPQSTISTDSDRARTPELDDIMGSYIDETPQTDLSAFDYFDPDSSQVPYRKTVTGRLVACGSESGTVPGDPVAY